MRVVINYSKPQSGNNASEIFGIDVAITHFMKAFFKYSRQDKFFFLPGSEESIPELRALADEAKIDFSRCAWLSPSAPCETLKDADILFRADPNMVDHIWKRLQVEGKGYAISSIVHTMSGERIAGVLGDFILSPTRVGDSIVCPSIAIRDAVKKLWEIQAEYYAARFKGSFAPPLDLPIIPLGIHTDSFIKTTTPQHRAAQRSALNISDDEVVILYVGRMSYATKAHPLPLFRAADTAARYAKKKVRLVMYGFFKPELMEAEFRQMAADFCQHIKVDFVLNNDPRFPEGVWAAGDIFTSLIDNIQESFGFTPIEAMASGLPAVISDWDGYRDGVRHGVDGFQVPTISLPENHALDVARHYYNVRNYGDYLIRNNQAVAVDIDFATAALQVLIEDAGRRTEMGASGRTRAVQNYDWRVVIKAYEDMWEEQAKKRTTNAAAHAPKNWAAVHPSYPDPSAMFGGFPSQHLSLKDRVELCSSNEDVQLISKHPMNMFGMDMLLPEVTISTILGFIFSNPHTSLMHVQTALKIEDSTKLLRTAAWLLKMGLVRRCVEK